MSKRIELRLYIGQTHGNEKTYYSSKQVKKLLGEVDLGCTIYPTEGAEGPPHPKDAEMGSTRHKALADLFEETSVIELDWDEAAPDALELKEFCKRLSDFLNKVDEEMFQRWALLKGFAFCGNSIYPIHIRLNLEERRSLQPDDFFRLYRKGAQKALESTFSSNQGLRIPSLPTPSMPPAPRANGILQDHIGPWCAKCLGYLEPGQIGAYHPYGQIPSVDDLWLHVELERVLGWTVPVHRYDCLSEGVALDAMAASGRLHPLLLRQTGKLENLANMTFARGNINVNIAARIALSHRYRKMGNKEEAAVELAKATISNAASSQSEVIGPILALHIPSLDNLSYQEIRVLLALGNRYRNIGRPDYAEKECYGKAEYIINKLSSIEKAKSLHALKRRELSVRQRCASSDEAKELIANAKDDAEPYGLRTTLHYIGWDSFRKNEKKEYVQAEDNFHAMLDDQELGANISWWHKMAGWLGLGAVLYVNNRGNFEKALCYCLMAEYVSAMLGLRVDVTRGISRLLLGRGKLLSTSTMVKKIGKERKVSRERMQELRYAALIESGLRKELLAELSGASWAL